MEQDHGRVPAAPGSHPTGHAGCAVDGAARFDPSRDEKPMLVLNKMLSEVRTKLVRLRAKEEALCELRRRAE